MTLKAYQTQAQTLRSFRGKTCVRATTGAYSWSLLLDFGSLGPANAQGYREPEYGLVIECPWRLEDRAHVIVGSGDDAEIIDARLQPCVGKHLVRLSIHRPSYMVHVYFTDDLSLWIFPDDTKDYSSTSEHPYSPWYVVGSAVSGGWEG